MIGVAHGWHVHCSGIPPSMEHKSPLPSRDSSAGGFTLVELVFVIAIITVLASIFLPTAFQKLQKADEVSADSSVQAIAAALAGFYTDLRAFPTCHTGSCAAFPGSSNQLVFLAFGDGYGSQTADYPSAATGSGNWDLTANDEATPERNNGANHLVQNDPDTNGTSGESTDYRTSGRLRWRGPYLGRFGLDPWGRTYIAYVGAMEASGKKVSGSSGQHSGWILSAGPNGSLDTLPSSNSLAGDDRGFVFHSQQ